MPICLHNANYRASSNFVVCLSPFVNQKSQNTKMSYKSVNALSIAVGKRLKSILDARHMPYGKLADAIDMPKSYLSEIMNGKRRCNSDHIEQFAAALGISPAELMEGEGEDEIRKAMRDVGSLCKEHQDDVLKYIAMKKKLQEIDKDKP